MIHRPVTIRGVSDLSGDGLEFRAGGTDVEARRHLDLIGSDLIDLSSVDRLRDFEVSASGARFGAMIRLGRIAGSAEVIEHYPAIALTAGSVANPHIRAVATLGGNIGQHTRCWYHRTGQVDCFKTGGDCCPARGGIDDWAVVYDTSQCIAPHPSSMAMALLAHDADLEIDGEHRISIAEALGTGSDPSRTNALESTALITAVILDAPFPSESAAYHRTTAQAMAEWPIVEAVARISVVDGVIESAAVAVGGVAPIPLRCTSVEKAIEGVEADGLDWHRAANLAGDDHTCDITREWKRELMRRSVLEVLERAISGVGMSEATFERAL